MFCVIFAWPSDSEKEKEIEARGFKKQTVYIKHTFDKKEVAEIEMYNLKVHQFAATDYWGMGPD